jgi:CO dehydrogenase/acetyl-CoA synthase gamma subunit (corrinoid Fe-S protein)
LAKKYVGKHERIYNMTTRTITELVIQHEKGRIGGGSRESKYLYTYTCQNPTSRYVDVV